MVRLWSASLAAGQEGMGRAPIGTDTIPYPAPDPNPDRVRREMRSERLSHMTRRYALDRERPATMNVFKLLLGFMALCGLSEVKAFSAVTADRRQVDWVFRYAQAAQDFNTACNAQCSDVAVACCGGSALTFVKVCEAGVADFKKKCCFTCDDDYKCEVDYECSVSMPF